MKQWALLLALTNALLKNSFIVDPEDLRSVCQDKGFYDQANFAAALKGSMAKLFKAPLVTNGSPQQLSSEGQEQLAAVIRSLAGKE